MNARTTRRRTAVRLAAITAVAALSLAACGTAADEEPSGGDDGDGGETAEGAEPVTLRIAWSGSDDRTRRTQEALDLYMERNPHVTVEVEFTTSTNFWDRLTTQVAGGNAPDIIQMSGQVLAQYATSDVLLDVEPYIGEQVNLDGWEQELLDRQTVDGTLYGVPPGVDGHAILFDATKLAELGIDPPAEDWTWSDYGDLVREIKAAAGDQYWGSEDGGPQYEVLQTFLAQRGKYMFDDGELGFTRDDVAELWGMFGELQAEGVIVPPQVQTEYGANPENSGIVQGYAAMDFTTSSQFTNFVGLSPNEVGITTYPFGDDGEPGQVWRAGLAWSVTRTSAHPEEALKLVDFLVNDPDAAEILLTSRGVPASPAVREQVRELVDETEQKSFDHLATVQGYDAEITPLLPVGFGDFNDAYQRLYYEYAFGRLSLDEAVDQFMSEAAAAIG